MEAAILAGWLIIGLYNKIIGDSMLDVKNEPVEKSEEDTDE